MEFSQEDQENVNSLICFMQELNAEGNILLQCEWITKTNRNNIQFHFVAITLRYCQ